MRLFPSVDSLMNGQGGTLDELLATSRVVTDVGTDTAVDTF